MLETKICNQCGKSFIREHWNNINKKMLFCSKRCYTDWQRSNTPKGKYSHYWKGGKYITKDGYVRVHIPNHPMATTNGWLFEHHKVVYEILGRKLLPEENVHHIDGNKENNSRANLKITSRQIHAKIHSGNPSHRNIGEPNILILCACGCNNKLHKYDKRGRPRMFIHGHNKHKN